MLRLTSTQPLATCFGPLASLYAPKQMQKHLPQKLTNLDSQETWHTPDNWEKIQKAGLCPTRCFSEYVANILKSPVRISRTILLD